MSTANAIYRLALVAILCLLSLAAVTARAQEKPYKEGSVWNITMIRVKPGMFDVYMRDLLPLRKKITEEAQKQGLVVSSHILTGPAMGREDWDVMILDEFKNWAAFDGISAKFEAIERTVIGSEEKQVQLMTKRADVRDILGEKNMQELIIK